MEFERVYTKRHVAKAHERQKALIPNRNRSRRTSPSSLLLHEAVRRHTHQQEPLYVHTVSIVFRLMTAVLSDVKERAKISFLTKVGYPFLTSQVWLQTSQKHLSYHGTNLVS